MSVSTTVEVRGHELDVEVEYSSYGEYYPETYLEPASYPDVEIEGVFWRGRDIYRKLTPAQKKKIFTLCFNDMINHLE